MASMFSISETFNTAFKFLSTSASLAGILMLIRSVASEVFLEKLRSYFFSFFDNLFTLLSTDFPVVINEFNGMARNEVYDAADLYLSTKTRSKTKGLVLSKTKEQKNFAISMKNGEEIDDVFYGIQLKWRYNYYGIGSQPEQTSAEKKFFELNFHKKFKDVVIDSYLPHVLAEAKQIKNDTKVVKVYSGASETHSWRSNILEHPVTFDNLAIDPCMKNWIIDDLDRFMSRGEFYNKVGRVRKRGYLLYGPPGTGKSSLIAAIANYLKFDIYHLDLASILSNSGLSNVLLSTTADSIIAVEDIDCSIQVQDRKNQSQSVNSNVRLTLSGILNLLDGPWSSCVDERIIVFTTNHRDRLDPALLRPGRMDMHISLSYCTPCGFRLLAKNYIGIEDHELFGEIEEAIMTTEVTPAEVAEQLMRNNNDPDALLNELIQFLKVKKRENEKAKAKKNRAQQESTPSEGGQTEEEEIEQK